MQLHFRNLLLACGSACLLTTALQAQSYKLEGEVPFAFTAGNTTLERGTYTIQKQPSQYYEIVSNKETGNQIFITGNTGKQSKTPGSRLVFHRYGNEYFLSEIQAEGVVGTSLPMSRRERQANLATPPTKIATATVLLVASR